MLSNGLKSNFNLYSKPLKSMFPILVFSNLIGIVVFSSPGVTGSVAIAFRTVIGIATTQNGNFDAAISAVCLAIFVFSFILSFAVSLISSQILSIVSKINHALSNLYIFLT